MNLLAKQSVRRPVNDAIKVGRREMRKTGSPEEHAFICMPRDHRVDLRDNLGGQVVFARWGRAASIQAARVAVLSATLRSVHARKPGTTSFRLPPHAP